MLIEIQKIRRVPVKDENGEKIPNIDGEGILMEEKVDNEAIDVNSIKSIRPFRDNGKGHRDIEGDKCVIYLYNKAPMEEDEEDDKKSRRRTTSEIHVVAKYSELLEQVNGLKAKSV